MCGNGKRTVFEDVLLDPIKYTELTWIPKIMVWRRSLLQNMAIFVIFCLSVFLKVPENSPNLYRSFTPMKIYSATWHPTSRCPLTACNFQGIFYMNTPVIFWWGWVMSSSNHRQKIPKDLETSKWRFNFWDINYLVPQIHVYKRHYVYIYNAYYLNQAFLFIISGD